MEALSDTQLDQLLSGIQTPGQVDALYSKLLQRVINRSLEAELDVHLGYKPQEKQAAGRRGNSRNGKTTKTVKGTFGEMQIETPRDRDGSFQPQLVAKRQVRLEGLDEKILALFSRGMTTRDIASAMQDLYGVEVSHTLISQVTDAVLDEVPPVSGKMTPCKSRNGGENAETRCAIHIHGVTRFSIALASPVPLRWRFWPRTLAFRR